MEHLLKSMLVGNNLAYAASFIIGAALSCYILYNTLSFYILRERYHGIRFTTKNITYITMMIAVSVSVTILVSQIVPLTVIPSIRIIFEGLMVKITGFIFGPIVGFLCGLVTEFFMVLFVPSYLHPAFLVTIIAFGFISGLGSSFIKISKGSNLIIFVLINLFLFVFAFFMWYLIKVYNKDVSVFGIKMSSNTYSSIFLLVVSICVFIIWSWAIYYLTKGKKTQLNTLLPIILFASVEEFLVVVIITPWGDAANFGIGEVGYISIVIARLIQVPIKVILNVAILKTTYDIVNPLVKRDW
ncbi:hypothetical protein [Spiroplasma endosymbiont of Aspidapion aeneum]|uniref:hypothetical protein n=1 Tax=Spiroplasma endosymbiont of Aspidapion aeneum TaxID=3066276 RepID=UPI00313B579F